MNIEGINIKDIEFGEPIEERECNYRDGYIRGIYSAKNIIDSKQREIERLNKRVKEVEEAYLRTRHQYSELEGKYVIDEYVINELEKHCETMLSIFEQMTDEQRQEQLDRYKIYAGFLRRIQELKGDSSNE